MSAHFSRPSLARKSFSLYLCESRSQTMLRNTTIPFYLRIINFLKSYSSNCLFQTAGLGTKTQLSVTRTAQWRRRGSNPQPPACKAGALPIELRPRTLHLFRFSISRILNSKSQNRMGPGRLELPTSRLSGVRSNHLSYEPSESRLASRRKAGRAFGLNTIIYLKRAIKKPLSQLHSGI